MSVSFTLSSNRDSKMKVYMRGDRRKSKTEGLVTYRDMAFGNRRTVSGAHKLLSCRLDPQLIPAPRQIRKSKLRLPHLLVRLCSDPHSALPN